MTLSRTWRLLLTTCVLAVGASLGAEEMPDPVRSRMPTVPAWSVDVTDDLRVVSAGDVVGRAWRAAHPDPTGAARWFQARLALPSDAGPTGWPAVLELEEGRVVEAASLDGQDVELRPTLDARRFSDGRRIIILPLSAERPAAGLALRARRLEHVASNGFGRVVLRAARPAEVLACEDRGAAGFRWRSASPFPLAVRVAVRQEDYVGALLDAQESSLVIVPGGSADLPAPAAAPGRYKLRTWAATVAGPTFDHWRLDDGLREIRYRPEVVRLGDGWSCAWADGPIGGADSPPAEGWTPVVLPHIPAKAEHRSHGLWYRTRLVVPSGWTSARLQLYLPMVRYRASIRLDGRSIAELPNWRLPASIDLPAGLAPGSVHDLAIGVTDYIVALRSDVPPPPGGGVAAPMRGLVAAVGHFDAASVPIGLPTVPELVGTAAVALEELRIQPLVAADGRRLVRVLGTVRNRLDQDVTIAWDGVVEERGRPLGVALTATIAAAAGADTSFAAEVDASALPWWSPADPRLLALTSRLTAEGAELDRRQDRFGFRTFGIDGDRFTLNGAPWTPLGGSHVLLQDWLWPAAPHPYGIVRHHFHSPPTGFGQGRIVLHVADELGMLVKAENLEHNAHVAERFAYQLPETWANVRSEIEAVSRSQYNHPSIVFWDVGNELSFRGPGEPQRMGELMQGVRAMDPTRLVTVGGSTMPEPCAIIDRHGFGEWASRVDRFFTMPEIRPSLWRTAGFFSRPARGEPAEAWIEGGGQPGWGWDHKAEDPRGRLHAVALGRGKPLLLSEGHYYENEFPDALTGDHGRLPFAIPSSEGWAFGNAIHWGNILAARHLSIANVRQSGAAASMIHVDRGVGRAISPLAAFDLDRAVRVPAGSPYASRWTVHRDLPGSGEVTVQWSLIDAGREVACQAWSGVMAQAQVVEVPVRLDIPVTQGGESTLRLVVRARAADDAGVFEDQSAIQVFAPSPVRWPASRPWAVLDPGRRLEPYLPIAAAPRRLASLAEWDPASPLLIASDALAGIDRTLLPRLRDGIAGGARVAVLDHTALPQFLATTTAQKVLARSAMCQIDGGSPVLAGLVPEDFRSWQTAAHDELVFRNPFEAPPSGRVRVLASGFRTIGLLEVFEGAGAALLCQMNLAGALGRDPAADRLLANIVAWLATPTPASRPTLLLAGEAAPRRALRSTYGLEGTQPGAGAPLALPAGGLVVHPGGDAAARQPVSDADWSAFFASSGTLLVLDGDEATAGWLSHLAGSQVSFRPRPFDRAVLTGIDPVTAGLVNSSFWWKRSSSYRHVDWSKPQAAETQSTGLHEVAGPAVQPLLEPAFLARIPVGQGGIVVSTVRSLDYPVGQARSVLAALLGNLGASLRPGGIAEGVAERWAFTPLPLGATANWSLADAPSGRRGWHIAGDDNDLRMLPRGDVAFAGGVLYRIPGAEAPDGHEIIGLGLTKGQDLLPRSVSGIPVGRRAERLWFCHASAWGVPQLTYRVWYAEERKAWIPGKPDPFIDVVMHPGEQVADWWFAGAVARGEVFLSGAQVAWKGQNPNARASGTEAGVYQAAWDNPHPDQEIESVDVIGSGEGMAFIIGLSAADRVTGPSSDFTGSGLTPAQIGGSWAGPRYGIAVQPSGLAVVVDAAGAPLARFAGYYAQGSAGVGRDQTFSFLGQQSDGAGEVTVASAPVPTITATGRQAALAWSLTYVCQPGAVEVAYRYEVVDGFPAATGTPNVWLTLDRLPEGFRSVSAANEWPVVFQGQGGTMAVDCDPDHRTWHGSPGYHHNGRRVIITLGTGARLVRGNVLSGSFRLQVP